VRGALCLPQRQLYANTSDSDMGFDASVRSCGQTAGQNAHAMPAVEEGKRHGRGEVACQCGLRQQDVRLASK